MSPQRAAASIGSLVALLTCGGLLGPAEPQAQSTTSSIVPSPLFDRAAARGRVRVLVELRVVGDREGEGVLTAPAVQARRRAIDEAGGRVVAAVTPAGARVVRRFRTVPYLALDVGPGALALLQAASDVAQVREDRILRPMLATSTVIVQADQVWDSGYDGAGTTIAIVDSGVDATHPFLGGKVTAEACFSSTVEGTSVSLCPNGLEEQVGPGSAIPCPRSECIHGTHVAGIAAGSGAAAGESFSGVARNADLMAVQVFSDVIDSAVCGISTPCMGAFESDVIAGLEHVYLVALEGSSNIASVNMSLGGGTFAGACDAEPYKPAIDNLRAIGIASIAASGNGFDPRRMAAPACISTAVSVGSTSATDAVSFFSNVSPSLSLLAPGESIRSSTPVATYQALSGTSMSAPHVAGGWALIRQAVPGAGVDVILDALRTTGLPVRDTRFWGPGTTTTPRVRFFQALAALTEVSSPVPTLVDVAPARVRSGAPATLTLSGSGFNALSAVQWNGTAVATTAVSTTTLRATIPAASLVVGTSHVSVSNPAPGGGVSASVAVPVDPPVVLAVDETTVGPASAVTVTLENGYGGAKDWLALASTGAPDTTYLQWTYVGAGVTTRTWTATLPATAGTYEFRLFLDNGYTRAGSSPPVTVDPSLNPKPAALALTPASATAGAPDLSVSVSGSGFVGSSVVLWNGSARPTTYVSASQVRATIAAADLAGAGVAQVSVSNPAPGGGVSGVLAFAVNPPPALAVSASSVPAGAPATVTLTGGPGGASDWMALAAVGAPDTSHLQWTYVGAGVTARTWTVTMPSTIGTYEFRLFLNNGYTRAATSPPVTVTAPPSPVPVLGSLSPSSAASGTAGLTLTALGSGFAQTSVIQWNGAPRPTTFISATQLRAAIPASDLAAPGTAQIAVFTPAPGGGLSGSLPFTVNPAASLTVSTTAVAAGGSVTVTLSSGPGGASDWLALAATSAPNTAYLQWVYVGAGVTSRTWTVAMPSTPGTYEFRLFLNNGYTRAATSPPVTVATPPAPSLSVSATAVAAGTPVTVTLINGPGGSSDWLALASTSAPNTSYLQWVYVGSGVTSRTWTVTMPAAAGTYEFRLFLNNGYTRAATSPPVTVSSGT